MKLWLISQSVNDDYDTYDSAVVAAETENAARAIHPNKVWPEPMEEWGAKYGTWASPEHIKVRLIGTALPNTPPGVICASFNAG